MSLKPQTGNRKPKLIVALDVDNLQEAERMVSLLYPAVNIFKVGSQLFTAFGPKAVEMVGGKGARVFLDLKFHDIPHTVFQSTGNVLSLAVEPLPNVERSLQPPVFMMTVHIKGGRKMLEEAMRGAAEKAAVLNIQRPFIVGVTRLTSDSNEIDTLTQVLEAAGLAKDTGLDGVVCSVHEAARVRKECGEDFLIVTPGIRPEGYPSDDQSRAATAGKAAEAGVDFIVVGRPIIKAENPLGVARDIINQICSLKKQ
ncbi:MAG: orotidine-5'-phosphate decarboxylase [Candidatus Omnitrophota bacterium]